MKHYLQLHLLVLLLATTAILGELISLPAAGLVIWRTLFASLGAAAWVTLVRRHSLWPGKRAARAYLGIGFVVGLHWICFFGAVKLANISVCLAGMATISLFTAFTEPLLEKRRIRPFEVLLGLLVVAGIGVVAGFVGKEHLLGLGVALISAFLASVFPVLNRKLVTGGSDPLTMVAWEMAGALTAALLLFPFVSGGFSLVAWKTLLAWKGLDWLWLLLLALVCTVFAHGFHISLLKHLSAYTMNLAFNFEPLYGILAAALFFGEYKELHPLFYAGLATILLANLLHPLMVHRIRRRQVLDETSNSVSSSSG